MSMTPDPPAKEVSAAEAAGDLGTGAGKRYTERQESGLTELVEKRMMSRAIREGWMGDTRWPTHVTASELEKLEESRGELTLKESALKAVLTDLASDEPRFRQIAAKSAIAMEKQNQDDEHKVIGDTVEHHHSLDVSGIMKAMLNEPDYIDSLRSRALEDDSEPSPVCENSESGPLENGETSSVSGPEDCPDDSEA